jgi:GT2 family glycosyltransferase
MTRSAGERAAILVLGMHRSGTSALARLLNVLGAELPEQLLGPGWGNPLGHWEALRLLEINEEALAAIDRAWDDPRAIPRRWFRSRAAYRFQERLGDAIAAAYGDAPLILIKDPRICRLAPLYIDVLDARGIEPLVILPLRHPVEVIRSIEERNCIDPLTIELLWVRYLLEAEEATRPCTRVWTSFECLLDNWEATVQRITDGLGIAWPNGFEKVAAQVPSILRSRHRHYNVNHDPAPALLGLLTLRTWQAAQLGLAGDETAARAAFDEIRVTITELDRLSLPQQERIDQRLAGAESGRQQLQELLTSSQIAGSEANARCERLNQELQERATQIAQLQMDLTKMQAELVELRATAGAANKARTAAEDRARRSSVQVRRSEEARSVAQERLRQLSVRVAASEEARAAAEESARQASAKRNQMLGSLTWRAAHPFHRLAKRFPLSIRTPFYKLLDSILRLAYKTFQITLEQPNPPRALPLPHEQNSSFAEAIPRLEVPTQERYLQWISEREHRNYCVSNSHHSEREGIRISFLIAGREHGESLARTLESIRKQTSPAWEAVVGLRRNEYNVFQEIKRLFSEDQGFILTGLDSSDKAFELSNVLPVAKGDFVAVLDPGDVLSPFAVEEIEAALRRDPNCDIWYSDEDRLSDSGERQEPYFKPEWSPELLYASNYFGRLTVAKRQLVVDIGGFDQDLSAAVEWDLNLRLTEVSSRIRRITRVLCHREPGSDRDRSFPGTVNASFHRAAIEKFWLARGIPARIETQSDGTQRSVWDLDNPPLVSIIIPNKNRHTLLQMCMAGILENTDYERKEVIVVDNASDDQDTVAYYEELRQHPELKIVHFNRPFNYSAICNYGASFATGELLLFLNNDIEVRSSDWLKELVRFAMRPGVGVVGTKLVYPSHALQHAGVVVGMHLCGLVFRKAPENEWGIFGSPNVPRNYLAIMGACQLVRREVFARVGGFDEGYQQANSDIALCLHASRAGYRIAYTPFASLVHREGASRGYTNPLGDLQRTAAEIQRLGFTDDPYFHPELSATNPIPTLCLGEEPSIRENLEQDISRLLSSVPSASALDLHNDQEIQRQTNLPREGFLWAPQQVDAIDDHWSAARYCIDLLRDRFDLRLRFPFALSGGCSGEFFKWATSRGADELGLPKKARDQIQLAFEKRLSARARQLLYFRDDLREAFPIGLTPIGRRELFCWFIRHGPGEANLRLEEIWWFFLECAEKPARELVETYLFTPEWQRAYPDGLTIFGRRALANWLAAKFDITEDWIDPERWPVQMTPAQQIRLAYHAREHWQDRHPDALMTLGGAHGLLAWLETLDSGLSDDVRRWCCELDLANTATELIVPGVNVIGHFCYPSGLRTSVEAIRDGLNQAGVALSLRDVRTDTSDDPYHADYSALEYYQTTILHLQPEPFFETAFSRADMFERAPRTYRIAYWYWELDVVPESWRKQWSMVDEVWAASNFVADALRKRLGGRVYTMFPGVQLGKFQPRPRSYFGLPDNGKFTFAFAFHMTSVMERKNPLGLIQAFRQAFAANEPVALVLKTTFGDRHPQLMQQLCAAADGANVTIINQVFTRDETLSLINVCDAYISLHRSEGLGLTMAEAMLLGKPVIATRYSGNVDFMDDSNSLLIDCQLVKLAKTIRPYDADGYWAEPSLEHAARVLREVYENQEWAAKLGAKAESDLNKRASTASAGLRMAKRLAEISALRRSSPG